MKSAINYIVIGAIVHILVLIVPACQTIPRQRAAVSLQVFYNEMAPYGQWFNDPDYGYVWAPAVEAGFQPYYTNGYWVMTAYGQMWVSDYPWGWAPFHYGRWVWSDFHGWLWIPDTIWGPAWVSWRSGGGYYGWAPLMPGININVSFSNYNCPLNWWIFIPERYIHSRSFHRYREDHGSHDHIFNATTFVQNTYVYNQVTYVAGPNADDVSRATREKAHVYGVRELDRPQRTKIEKKTVGIYRPEFRVAEDKKQPPVPPGLKNNDHPLIKKQRADAKDEEKPAAIPGHRPVPAQPPAHLPDLPPVKQQKPIPENKPVEKRTIPMPAPTAKQPVVETPAKKPAKVPQPAQQQKTVPPIKPVQKRAVPAPERPKPVVRPARPAQVSPPAKQQIPAPVAPAKKPVRKDD